MIATTKYLLSTILIGILAIITYATIKWWVNTSVWNLSDFDPFVKLLVSLSGVLLWLGLIIINLKYQLPRANKNSVFNIFCAVLASFITLITVGLLLNFTGLLLAILNIFLIVVFAIFQTHNRSFFYPFASIMIAVPAVYLLTHQYKLDRLMMVFSGIDNQTLNFIANTNQSLDKIGINTPKLFLFFLIISLDLCQHLY